MPRKKTSEEYNSQLKVINPTIKLIDEYRGKSIKVHAVCLNCHNEWLANPGDLLAGHSCPKCALYRQKNSQRKSQDTFIEDLERINPNVELLGKYINNHRKCAFKCKICGRIWEAVPNSLLLGHGCPDCAKSSTSFFEQAIYKAFMVCLGENAVLHRSKKLIGKELDIYIPEFRFAIEPGSWKWHHDKLERDIQKRALCSDEGVRLLSIYSDYHDINPPFSEDCIICKSSLGSSDWEEAKKVITHLLYLFSLSLSESEWEIVREYALLKSKKRSHSDFVTLLSSKCPNIEIYGHYRDSAIKTSFRCKVCGFIWDATPNSILMGHGCPTCARERTRLAHVKSHEEFLKELQSVSKSIRILGKYVNSKQKINCECLICGNHWEAIPNNLLRGQGCPLCGHKRAAAKNRKSSSDFISELALVNPTITVLGEYEGTNKKILVQCQKCDYKWETKPVILLKGHKCAKCAKKLKKTNDMFIEELKQIHPNIIPLEDYINAITKIQVRCTLCKHEWKSCPHDLLRGHGCPHCSKRKKHD